MARTSGLCGAVSGGIMGISLATGRTEWGAPVHENYALVQKFVATFEEKFGSINCAELTGCDLGTEAGQVKFRESGQGEKCFHYVEEATRVAITLLDQA